ncbi:MAG TPA: PQQ-binding-like beta-propeller repeat protein, partial [Pseudomonadales bacterium]
MFDVRSCAALLAIALPIALHAADSADTQWPTYGNDEGGSRYSSLTQVDRGNVATLTEVWRYRTGDLGDGIPSSERMAYEATPILLDGVLYLSTPYGHVHALDAATGARFWHYDAQLPARDYSENTSRGVSAWRDPVPRSMCALRIFFGTLDARLIALDGATGQPCPDFGVDGAVDLNKDTRPRDEGDYLVTSPPVVFRNLVITGSAVGDNRAVDNEL